MNNVFVYCEMDGCHVADVSLELLTKGRKLANELGCQLEAICAGIGVAPEHIRVVVPLKKNYEEMKQVIREEINYKGVSVIIPRRECIQTLARKKRNK